MHRVYSFAIRVRLVETKREERTDRKREEERERERERMLTTMGGRLTAGRGLCAPRVISNVPGCRDSTLMERVALTPAFARQARRSSEAPSARALGYAFLLRPAQMEGCERFLPIVREITHR